MYISQSSTSRLNDNRQTVSSYDDVDVDDVDVVWRAPSECTLDLGSYEYNYVHSRTYVGYDSIEAGELLECVAQIGWLKSHDNCVCSVSQQPTAG